MNSEKEKTEQRLSKPLDALLENLTKLEIQRLAISLMSKKEKVAAGAKMPEEWMGTHTPTLVYNADLLIKRKLIHRVLEPSELG